ncbi:9809_t:CDS:2 [Ambispora gerdemannii]|uniref:9809_t:CDS:1 n=1 Tax=Ambispora gerdemannii TaxID=144530 RepID=A0A9N9DHT3_9GLOM|nr:9809_t:CDS:2 [Ambispora gerdemannii]
MSSHIKVSKGITHSIRNVSQKGTFGNEFASGSMQKLAIKYVSSALKVPYFLNETDEECIRQAIPHRLIIFDDENAKDVAHGHLKFLAEYVAKSVKLMNFSGQDVKLIGPKFDKEEVDCFKTARSIHYCTKSPVRLDEVRRLSSSRAIQLKLKCMKRELGSMMVEYTAIVKKILDNPTAGGADKLVQRRKILDVEIAEKEYEVSDLETSFKTINSQEPVEVLKCCNVGVENCNVNADVMVAFDSLYDVDLQQLIVKAEKLNVSEIYATIILPFGLLYVDRYYSEELNVTFIKHGDGFLMVHGQDMSNGYVHEYSVSVMRLMENSFIKPADGNREHIWTYEIIKDVAEICLLRFYRAKETKRVVRKKLPSKFDKYTIIMHPVEYFSRIPRRPIMVPTQKLNVAVSRVKREKNMKTIVEDLYAYVQCMFFKVVGMDRDLLTEAYKVARKEYSIFEKIIKEMSDWLKMTAEHIPFVYKILDFFTAPNCKKYMDERIDLQDLILDSRVTDIERFNDHFKMISKGFVMEIDTIPTLVDVFKSIVNGDDSAYYQRLSAKYSDKELQEFFGRHSVLSTLESYNKALDQTTRKYDIERKNREDELERKRKEIETLKDEEHNSEGESMTAGLSVVQKTKGEHECDIGEVINLTESVFGAHNAYTVQHLQQDSDKRMDDLTAAAFKYNCSRLEGKTVKQLSDAQIKNLIKRLTKQGKVANTTVTVAEAIEAMHLLKMTYSRELPMQSSKVLFDLKKAIFESIKTIAASETVNNITEKKVEVIKGLAGAGKTFYVCDKFEPSEDAYISPMADVLYETERVLYIDEAGAFNKQYLIFIMLMFNVRKFVFLGDDEQTKYFDPFGDLGTDDFCSLVDYKDITVMYFSFRFGPTVAAHLNTAFNYPVFSLKNTDTKLFTMESQITHLRKAVQISR